MIRRGSRLSELTQHGDAVWGGVRRTYGALPEEAAPLMLPELFDVLDACPTTKTWRTPSRPAEPDLAGARDRARCCWSGPSACCAAARSPH